jgi:hypothetical protein
MRWAQLVVGEQGSHEQSAAWDMGGHAAEPIECQRKKLTWKMTVTVKKECYVLVELLLLCEA